MSDTSVAYTQTVSESISLDFIDLSLSSSFSRAVVPVNVVTEYMLVVSNT